MLQKKDKTTKSKSYTVTDHKGMVLNIESDGGKWLVVTCPFDPELVTQARTIDEAFVMAYDAKKLLDACRAEAAQSPRAKTNTRKPVRVARRAKSVGTNT